jgi:integrase/recombinase XerC
LIQEELLSRFRDYLQYERRYSVHTLESYTTDCQQFCGYLSVQYNIVQLGDVTHHHVRSWVVSLLKEKNQSVTVRRKISSISHLFKWMRRMDYVTHNPVLKIKLPKIPERLPKSLSASIIKKLWHSLGKNEDPYSYGILRDKALIGLLYGCGLRRSEVIGLTWDDYDESRQLLRVMGKGRKYRQVPVSENLKIILESLRKSSLEKWGLPLRIEIILMENGKPCYPKFVHNSVVRMIGSVTTADKMSPHTLRHSMATHMMDQGAELNAVKSLLGHASLAATQVYTHNSITRLKEVYQQAHPNAKHDA